MVAAEDAVGNHMSKSQPSPESSEAFTSELLGTGFSAEKGLEYLRLPPQDHSCFYLNPSRYGEEIEAQVRQQMADANQSASGRPLSPDDIALIRKEVEADYQTLLSKEQKVMALWMQSERLLRILRTKGLGPELTGTAEARALERFVSHIDGQFFPELNKDGLLYIGPRPAESICKTSRPGSPNDYFVQTHFGLVTSYGLPFYSCLARQAAPQPEDRLIDMRTGQDCLRPMPTHENLIGINSDFFAAFLGGDKRFGHDVVYVVKEDSFYFYDLVANCYLPTSKDKIRLWLSLTLQERAWGQNLDTATMILNTFRTKQVLDGVIAKAKALLAVDAGFFSAPNAKPRWEAARESTTNAACATSAVEFVRVWVESAEGSILTAAAVLERFRNHTGESGSSGSFRRQLDQAMKVVHGRTLRKDLTQPNGSCVASWKGLRLRATPVQQDASEDIDQGSTSAGLAAPAGLSGPAGLIGQSEEYGKDVEQELASALTR